MVKNIKGEPTYHRNMVRWIWTPVRQENELFRIAEKFGKNFAPSISLNDINVKKMRWSQLGPSADLFVRILRDYQLRVGCYRDGWHIILLHYSHDLELDLKTKVFGNINRNQVWTTETELVPQLMGQIYNELREYLEENK